MQPPQFDSLANRLHIRTQAVISGGVHRSHRELRLSPTSPPPAHTYTHTHTRIHTLDLLPHGAPALFHALYTSASMVVDGMLPFTWPKGQKKKGSYKRFVADIADTHVVLWGCC